MNDEFMQDIDDAGVTVEHQWPGTIERDDVRQELWVALLERPGSTDKLAKMARSERRNALIQMGHQIASRYRADYELFSGNVRYGTVEVRALLDEGALTMALDDVEAGSEPLTTLLDMSEGLGLLSEKNAHYHGLLISKYYQGDEITDRKNVTRARDALTDCMNKVHTRKRYEYTEGIGSRQVVSNSAAIAMNQIVEKGDFNDGRN